MHTNWNKIETMYLNCKMGTGFNCKTDEISILKLFNSLYFPGSVSRYNKSWPWLIFLLFQPTLYTTTIPSTILLQYREGSRVPIKTRTFGWFEIVLTFFILDWIFLATKIFSVRLLRFCFSVWASLKIQIVISDPTVGLLDRLEQSVKVCLWSKN